MEIFGFSAEIQENTWKFLDFQQKSKKNTWKFLDFQQKSKKHMEIQNFQKFLVRPIVLEILDFFGNFGFLEILVCGHDRFPFVQEAFKKEFI